MNFKKRVSGSWTDIPYYVHDTDTDTITTLPADIYANAATATVGLKGQTVQSGTPTPQNPVMPNGCGERTSNLWNGATIEAGRLDNGVVGYKSDTTNITFSDDILSFTTTANYRGVVSDLMPIDNEMRISYTLSSLMTKKVAWYAADTTFLSQTVYSTSDYRSGMLLSPPENAKFFRISFEPPTAGTYTIAYPKLNTGSTALPYEPYGYKLTISSANTTTPVYLGEVQSTRKVKKLVLTGQEAIDTVEVSGTNLFRVPIDYTRDKKQEAANTSMRCNAYPIATNRGTCASTNNTMSTFNATNDLRIVIHNNTYTTADEFKAYLAQQYAAGTPVTVWYVLVTEETAVVNEPLMKIGDYADEVSGITIPTIAGGDTISVGTTVQPSEVTANYKGWHPKTPKVSNNGQWS